MQKLIVLFARPTSARVQSEGRQVSLCGLQLHVNQIKWNRTTKGGRAVYRGRNLRLSQPETELCGTGRGTAHLMLPSRRLQEKNVEINRLLHES